ncbi:MAG: PEP-CTERM sorting domain-containing protein [Verrucomicrobia bacterium]|nr:PEP-CTERM sorting domain-containing protein [Verrucomicrobiota bacterium]
MAVIPFVPSLEADVQNIGPTFKDVRITFDLTNVPAGTQIGQNALPSTGNQPFASANNSLITPNFGFDVTVSGAGTIATLYDSTNTTGLDPDLEGGPNGFNWAGGNLDRDNDPNAPILGNLLIVQHPDNFTVDSNNLFTQPNDYPADNQVRLDFETGFTEIAVAWADNEEGGTSVTYGLDNGDTATIDFGEFIDSSSAFYDSSLAYDDHYANLLPTITVSDLINVLGVSNDATQIDWVEFNWGGPSGGASGGLAFLEGKTVDPVPEPSSFALLLGIASALFLVRRRNR